MNKSRLGSLFAAGAIALLVALTATAPAAYALSESTIKSECDQAGGEYTTTVINGDRYSMCCYRDNQGKYYCDGYKNGQYQSTAGRSVDLPITTQPGLPSTAPAVPLPGPVGGQ
jgi:hypothetical protein